MILAGQLAAALRNTTNSKSLNHVAFTFTAWIFFFSIFFSFHKTFCLLADFWRKKKKRNLQTASSEVDKHFLCKFEEIEWKEHQTSTWEGLRNTSITKCPTKSREWRAAVRNYHCFGGGGVSILSRRTLATIHIDFLFFFAGSRKKKAEQISFHRA